MTHFTSRILGLALLATALAACEEMPNDAQEPTELAEALATSISSAVDTGKSSLGSLQIDTDIVPTSVISEVAAQQAEAAFGQVDAAPVIPCYDYDEKIAGYIFNFRRGGDFPPEAGLEVLTAGQGDRFGRSQFAHLVLAARYSKEPIEAIGLGLSNELALRHELEQRAAAAMGTTSATLQRVYCADYPTRWYRYASGNSQIVLSSDPGKDPVSATVFSSTVRPALAAELNSEIAAARSAGLPEESDESQSAWQAMAAGQLLLRPSDVDPTLPVVKGATTWHPHMLTMAALVPFYDWHRGCTPTAAAMCLGYMDRISWGPWEPNLGRLVSYYFGEHDPVEKEWDSQIPDILPILADRMHTDSKGATGWFNISSGIREAIESKGYTAVVNSHGVPYLDTTFINDLEMTIADERPAVLHSTGHSNTAVGYTWRNYTNGLGKVYKAYVHDTHGGAMELIKVKSFYKLHTIIVANPDSGTLRLLSPKGDSWYNGRGGNNVWLRGSPLNILWETTAQNTGTVRIDIAINGSIYTSFTVPNTHSATWTVPASLPDIEDARVRLTWFDDNYKIISSDGSFGPSVVRTGLADLAVRDVQVYIPSTPANVSTYNIEVDVASEGLIAVDSSHVTLQATGDAYPSELELPWLCQGGCSILATFGRNFELGKRYTLFAKADSRNAHAELTENNNVKSTILASDLVVSGFSVSPNPAKVDAPFTITATVTNYGTMPSKATTVALRVGGETTGVKRSIPILKTWQSATVTRVSTLPVKGSFVVSATADADLLNEELIETNNTESRTLTVK